VGLLSKLRRALEAPPPGLRRGDPDLPDPSETVKNRGERADASLTDTKITELVKQQIKSGTKNWQR
jgi:hypothetical protein